MLLYALASHFQSISFDNKRGYPGKPRRESLTCLMTRCIHDASQTGYSNERGLTRGALSLNPWTLSLHCKRVLARYLAVESQAGRVAGSEGSEREREGGPGPG